jgi:zinc transport system ATP-binding protein
MYAVEFEKVSFAYAKEKILEHMIFRVTSGDFVALVGPNGAGKSTLIKLCVGLLTPTCGQIRVFGEPVVNSSSKLNIGYVPQNSLKDRSFPVTVEEVVAMGRVRALGMGRYLRKSDNKIVEDSLNLVEIGNLRKKIIGELSGGQQQRVLLARALATQPKLLVLDEPTAGVDTNAKENIYRHLKELNQNLGITILMVSHDVECVAQYANQIASIEKGLRYYGSSSGYCKKCDGQDIDVVEELKVGGFIHA